MTPPPRDDVLTGGSKIDGETAVDALVRAESLTKRYGDFTALDHCTVSVRRGEIFGLLGPNGAGKTTFIRSLLGFIRPTSGTATINGLDCVSDSVAIRRLVSYLPGDARLPRHMRGRGCLKFFSEMQPTGDLDRSLAIADQLELDLRRMVAFMSTGMRQKLALAAVLGAKTPLLILDEPTANLDPTVRGEVLKLVAQAAQEERTVIFSSHVLSEIEEVCDRVMFLRHGRLVRQQTMQSLRSQHRITMQVRDALPDPPSLQDTDVQIFHSQPDAPTTEHSDAWRRVTLMVRGDLAEIVGWLASCSIRNLQVESAGLRAVYDAVHRGDFSRGDSGESRSQDSASQDSASQDSTSRVSASAHSMGETRNGVPVS
ncbi:MAG: ABC transporter ATP-binding protein [Planctomycetota bacterium]